MTVAIKNVKSEKIDLKQISEDSEDHSDAEETSESEVEASETPLKSFDFLLDTINNIQDIMLKGGLTYHQLDLPQICVVGAQSVGKSSVLESFVGRQFLPRGKGIVTRRPLLLQLRNNKDDEEYGGQEYGQFDHLRDKVFRDFSKIRDEIVRETNAKLGGENSKCIDKDPIRLKISSPHVVNLTVIDLPGVTKVPVKGQPSDIEKTTKELVLSYIQNPSCIILAVSSATEDLANSVALGLARQVDPEHQRTYGVMTKIDCLGEGHDVVDVLKNKTYRLKWGFIGVVFRDSITDRPPTIRDARKEEMKFFASSEHYRQFLDKIGSEHLSKVLNRRLVSHIRDSLPKTVRDIDKLIEEKHTEFKELGLDMDENIKADPNAVIQNAIMEFTNNYKNMLDGRIDELSMTTETEDDEFVGGAKISNRLHTEFTEILEDIDEANGISDPQILKLMKNSSGVKCHIFVPDQAFQQLVYRRVSKFRDPSLEMAKTVSEDLIKILENCRQDDLIRYKHLRKKILDVTEAVVQKCLQPTYQTIFDHFEVELNYINTNHPNFVINQPDYANKKCTLLNPQTTKYRIIQNEEKGYSAMPVQFNSSFGTIGWNRQPNVKSVGAVVNQRSDHVGSENHVALMREFVESYVEIVKMNILDVVPKTIMTFLVRHSHQNLQKELFSNFNKPEQFESLLKQSDDRVRKEKHCRKTHKALLIVRNELKTILRSDIWACSDQPTK